MTYSSSTCPTLIKLDSPHLTTLPYPTLPYPTLPWPATQPLPLPNLYPCPTSTPAQPLPLPNLYPCPASANHSTYMCTLNSRHAALMSLSHAFLDMAILRCSWVMMYTPECNAYIHTYT
jgi:hypothetical protein